MALGLRAWCPWRKQQAAGANQRRESKSVNPFLGFFFLVNYALGGVILALPYSFLHAGLLIAIPTMLVVAFVGWINATWVLEVMARAQALESFSNFQRSFGELSNTEMADSELSPPLPLKEYCGSLIDIHKLHRASTSHPDFRIVQKHNFELSELCEIFFGKLGKCLYMMVLIIVSSFVALILANIASTAWATNIPLNFGPFQQCPCEAFHQQVIPQGSGLEGCRLAYYFCLCLFALIVVPLSLMNLKEQAIIQTIFGVMRVLLVVVIVVYCIVKLLEGGNICEGPISRNISNRSDFCSIGGTVQNFTAWRTLELHDIIIRFDWRGWLVVIPVCAWPFMLQYSIPSFTNPIRQKQYLWHFILCTYGFVVFLLVIMGSVPPLWFSAETQETVSLNWVMLTEPNNSPQLRALSYYIILLPSVQAVSNYPLNIHPLANNIYSVFVKPATCRLNYKQKCNQVLMFFIRLFAAIIPISVLFGVSNLVQVLQYSGVMGFVLGFIFPAALQLQSIRVCKRTFRDVHTEKTQFKFTAADPTENKLPDETEFTGTAEVVSSLDKKLQNDYSVYTTPYSSRIFSHPVAVSILGTIGFLLLIASIAGLLLHPEKIYCTVNVEQ